MNQPTPTDPLAALVAQVDGFKAQRAQLLDRRGALVARLSAVASAPLSVPEAVALCLKQVEARAAAFPELSGLYAYAGKLAHPAGNRPSVAVGEDGALSQFRTSHSGPINAADAATFRLGTGARSVDQLLGTDPAPFFCIPVGDSGRSAQFFASFMCFFFGDVIRERLESYMLNNLPNLLSRDHAVTPADLKALSAEQRIEEIAQLQGDIAQCDARLRELDEQIVAIPLDTEDRKQAARRLGVDLWKR